MSQEQIIQVVKAVLAVQEATSRIDHTLYPVSTTFYSHLDQWEYDAMLNACPICADYESVSIYPGTALRSLFPYHEIVDVDEIFVNAHPNCKCVLKRLI